MQILENNRIAQGNKENMYLSESEMRETQEQAKKIITWLESRSFVSEIDPLKDESLFSWRHPHPASFINGKVYRVAITGFMTVVIWLDDPTTRLVTVQMNGYEFRTTHYDTLFDNEGIIHDGAALHRLIIWPSTEWFKTVLMNHLNESELKNE